MDLFLIFLAPLLSFSIVVMMMGKFFEQAGYDPKQAMYPVYNVFLLLKIIKKKPFLMVLLLIPYINLVMIIWLVTEVLKSFSKRTTGQQILGIFFGYLYLPYLNFAGNITYNIDKTRTGSSQAKEWVDALIFAVVAATIIRMFVFEAYTIPTSSMEGSLLVGDFLFVSKFHYGARIPNTPIAFPFAHHSFPEKLPIIGGKKAYIKSPQLPYYRLPGFRNVERYDNVVFNYPAEKLGRPVDKKENYIKRCVGIPGDTLEVRNAVLYVNGEEAYQPEGMQLSYQVKYKPYKDQNIQFSQMMGTIMQMEQQGSISTNGKYLEFFEDVKCQLTDLDMNLGDIDPYAHGWDVYMLPFKDEEFMEAFMNLPFIDTISPIVRSPKDKPQGGIYPPEFVNKPWNVDSYGPIYIPKKGVTIELNTFNYIVYREMIQRYEGHKIVRSNDGVFTIDGEVTDSYTFEMNYYFMMGDNRHNSADSRVWGFVPESHIVGKAWVIWLSLDKYKTWFDGKLRWRRIFKPI